ncbi:MAG: hypothetical protein DLM50_06025 [Candidatus Meridianibacter frigidus]|nr:MAG: hypothetical protein DLM50_06025 [Candidatus Eremiobacteraeota bacterium]
MDFVQIQTDTPICKAQSQTQRPLQANILDAGFAQDGVEPFYSGGQFIAECRERLRRIFELLRRFRTARINEGAEVASCPDAHRGGNDRIGRGFLVHARRGSGP